jgi:DNA-binding GntR family transcriptional regulator
VEIVPYSGYLVGRISLEQARDLVEVRRILEGEAARLAAARIRDEEIPELLALARTGYRAHDADSFAEFLVVNRNFHVAIASYSRNDLLAKMIGDVLDRLQMALYMNLYASDPAEVAADHAAIGDAVARRDGAAACRAIHAEVDKLQRRLLSSGARG